METTVSTLKDAAVGEIVADKNKKIQNFLKEKLLNIECKNKSIKTLTQEIADIEKKVADLQAMNLEDALKEVEKNSNSWCVLGGNGLSYYTTSGTSCE